jgi:hypothetical protein
MTPTPDDDMECPDYNEDLFLPENWPETDGEWENTPDHDEAW